jgi:hypothetical protein
MKSLLLVIASLYFSAGYNAFLDQQLNKDVKQVLLVSNCTEQNLKRPFIHVACSFREEC